MDFDTSNDVCVYRSNLSEAGPEVALLNDRCTPMSFNCEDETSPGSPSYDTRTITRQTFTKMNSKFGTFTRKACGSIEKFQTDIQEEFQTKFTSKVEKASDESGIEDSPSHDVSKNADRAENTKKQEDTEIRNLEETKNLDAQMNDAYLERDQAISALRAYEELLRKINENHMKRKRSSLILPASDNLNTNAGVNMEEKEKIVRRNAILERTVDNLELTVQDTMARMNDIKDVNQELKNVLTDQQDMLAQYKSTIEQKSYEYRDLQVKHEARIDALVTENKRDRALLEKQITLLRAEAHMKSLENERLESECRIKGEQLARLTEMLNELRQSY